jgi:hypothetical protein
MRTGKLDVLFNSSPTEFREGSVSIEVAGEVKELPNDFVWIFAGGIPPSDFLKAAGVAFGSTSPSDSPPPTDRKPDPQVPAHMDHAHQT